MHASAEVTKYQSVQSYGRLILKYQDKAVMFCVDVLVPVFFSEEPEYQNVILTYWR